MYLHTRRRRRYSCNRPSCVFSWKILSANWITVCSRPLANVVAFSRYQRIVDLMCAFLLSFAVSLHVVVAYHIILYHVARLSELVVDEVDKICSFGWLIA